MLKSAYKATTENGKRKTENWELKTRRNEPRRRYCR